MRFLRSLREGLAAMFDICPKAHLPKFKRRDPKDDAKRLADDWRKVEGDLAKAFQKFKDEQEND